MIAIIGTSDRPCWLAEACKILLLLLQLRLVTGFAQQCCRMVSSAIAYRELFQWLVLINGSHAFAFTMKTPVRNHQAAAEMPAYSADQVFDLQLINKQECQLKQPILVCSQGHLLVQTAQALGLLTQVVALLIVLAGLCTRHC